MSGITCGIFASWPLQEGHSTAARSSLKVFELTNLEGKSCLVKKYSDEIRMIDNLLKSLRAEKVNFYKQEVPIIIEKLKKEEIIDEIVIDQWIDRLSSDIEQSFLISERLIETYLTKSIEEFKQAIGDKVPW